MLNDVTIVSSGDVWAVGDYYNPNGALLTLAERWNGSAWTSAFSQSPGGIDHGAVSAFDAVDALSPTDIRAVGSFHGGGFDPPNALIESWCP
jgi:hypothetical protein